MGINKRISNPRSNWLLITMAILFFISFVYFKLFAYHIFPYQESQVLFVWNREYLMQFLSMPGGLLVYVSNFLTQFFFYPVAGAAILSIMLTLFALTFYKTGEFICGKSTLLQAISILPGCLLLIIQSDYNSGVYISAGLLLVAASFLAVIRQGGKGRHFYVLVVIAAIYFISGVFAWIFAAVFIVHYLVHRKILMSFILIAECAVLVILSKEYLFYQTLHELIFYPAGLHDTSLSAFIVLSCCLILYPAALKLLKKVLESGESISPYLLMIIFSATLFFLSRLYNPEISGLFRIEGLAQKERWDELIRYQEKVRYRNVVAQYYYNLALSETDQLCDRLFSSPQDFGPGSLMVQWDSGLNINQIYRGVYFFYSIGLINEAHRWAYESMVMQGYRSGNLTMLIKTELIRGNYRVAEKYIGILKKTLNYKVQALGYEKMLNHPELIREDKDMGRKISLCPKTDFLIRLRDQQANVLLMLKSNPSNRRAFEYMMAWYMLERNPEMIEREIPGMKFLGYERIPRHIEEAIVYQDLRSGRSAGPDISVSPDVVKRFRIYQDEVRKKGTISFSENGGGRTFWAYIDKL